MTFQKSESIANLTIALAKVQKELKPVKRAGEAKVKTLKGGEYSYSYVTFEDVCSMVLPLLNKAGLAVFQPPYANGDRVGVTTILAHESGEFISGSLDMQPRDNSPQSAGSCVTYLRRYSLCSMVGVVADEDDDAQAAQPESSQRSAPRTSGNGHRDVPPNVNPQTGEITDDGLLTVRNVAETTGTSKSGKAWTKFTVHFSDGSKASTFSGSVGDLAKKAKREGLKLRVLTKQGQYGSEIEALDVVTAEEEPPGLMDESIPF